MSTSLSRGVGGDKATSISLLFELCHGRVGPSPSLWHTDIKVCRSSWATDSQIIQDKKKTVFAEFEVLF